MLESMTPIEAAPFIHILAKQAFEAGASLVEVLWGDDELRKIRIQHGRKDTLEELLDWQFTGFMQSLQNGDALLVIHAHDPDLFISCDPNDLALVRKINDKASGPARQLISKGATNWLVIAVPVRGWSRKVFPGLPEIEQDEKMWETIFQVSRITNDDPVAAWRDHIVQLDKRAWYLNQKQYKTLEFRAEGTDLRMGLPEDHTWCSGNMTSQRGITFTSNIPTEEVFTLPHREQIDGVVSSSRPLSHGGALMDNFSFTFKQGKIIDIKASKGKDSLERLLETDDGARSLGEVALVPHNSPISRSGLLFFNTLFDENASSHLALGNGYNFCLPGGERMSDEEFSLRGGNRSNIHVDFMFGTGDMNIDGITKNGSREAVMRSGEWAF